MYRETKSREAYRKLAEYGDRCPQYARILWTKKRVYAVFWGVRGLMNNTDEVAAAVQRVLASAQQGHQWPDKMPDSIR